MPYEALSLIFFVFWDQSSCDSRGYDDDGDSYSDYARLSKTL